MNNNLLASHLVLNVVLFCFVIHVLFVIRLRGGQCDERIIALLCLHCKQAFVHCIYHVSISRACWYIFLSLSAHFSKMIPGCLFTVNARPKVTEDVFMTNFIRGIPVTFYTKHPLLKKQTNHKTFTSQTPTNL